MQEMQRENKLKREQKKEAEQEEVCFKKFKRNSLRYSLQVLEKCQEHEEDIEEFLFKQAERNKKTNLYVLLVCGDEENKKLDSFVKNLIEGHSEILTQLDSKGRYPIFLAAYGENFGWYATMGSKLKEIEREDVCSHKSVVGFANDFYQVDSKSLLYMVSQTSNQREKMESSFFLNPVGVQQEIVNELGLRPFRRELTDESRDRSVGAAAAAAPGTVVPDSRVDGSQAKSTAAAAADSVDRGSGVEPVAAAAPGAEVPGSKVDGSQAAAAASGSSRSRRRRRKGKIKGGR